MGRTALLGWLGLGVFAACLPEVTIDESLSPLIPANGGAGGMAGAGPSSGGADSAGSAGSAGMGPSSAGAGGTGSAGMGPSSAGAGGAGSAGMGPGSAGAGGAGMAAGAGGMNAGAAGTDGGGVAVRCPQTTDLELACAAYCQLYNSTCDNDFTTAYDYEARDGADCASVCYNSGWPIGGYAEPGSILCRCYHSYLALTQGLTPHCFHAAQFPTMGGCQIVP